MYWCFMRGSEKELTLSCSIVSDPCRSEASCCHDHHCSGNQKGQTEAKKPPKPQNWWHHWGRRFGHMMAMSSDNCWWLSGTLPTGCSTCNPGIVGEIVITDTGGHMCQEVKPKSPQAVVVPITLLVPMETPRENTWPHQEPDLANHQLTSVLNGTANWTKWP